MEKFASVESDGVVMKMALPCSLRDVRQVFGSDVFLMDTKTKLTFSNEGYPLKSNFEYIVARGMEGYESGTGSALVTTRFTLSLAAAYLEQISPDFPVPKLEANIKESLSRVADVSSILPKEKQHLHSLSIDDLVYTLLQARTGLDQSQVDLIEKALTVLLQVQKAMRHPIVTQLMMHHKFVEKK